MRWNYLIILLLFAGCTAQQIQQAKGSLDDYLKEEKLTAEDVARGLKEALIQGTDKGTSKASQLNGYLSNPQLKIPFPPDVQKVEKKLREIGLGNEVDRFVETLNRGAEQAAKEAKPIFVSAITSMSIQDAWGILKGEENAATQYLQRTTSAQLADSFKPVIKKALDNTSATKYYNDIITTYNKIPFIEKVNPDLESYATSQAIKGLFILVAEEEKNIRKNPGARTTELLKKVFSQQD